MEAFLNTKLQWLQDDNMDIDQGDTIDQHWYIENGSLVMLTSPIIPHLFLAPPNPQSSGSRPFAPSKTENEVEDAQMKAVSQKTQQDTNYCGLPVEWVVCSPQKSCLCQHSSYHWTKPVRAPTLVVTLHTGNEEDGSEFSARLCIIWSVG